MADVGNIRDEAILESGTSWDQYVGFADENEWLDWITKIAESVTQKHADKAGDAWTLENSNFFEAAVFETVARMLRRQVNQANSSLVGDQEITVGPITIRPPRANDSNRSQLQSSRSYSRLAEVRLMAEGVGRKKAAIKVLSGPSSRVCFPLTVSETGVQYEEPEDYYAGY